MDGVCGSEEEEGEDRESECLEGGEVLGEGVVEGADAFGSDGQGDREEEPPCAEGGGDGEDDKGSVENVIGAKAKAFCDVFARLHVMTEVWDYVAVEFVDNGDGGDKDPEECDERNDGLDDNEAGVVEPFLRLGLEGGIIVSGEERAGDDVAGDPERWEDEAQGETYN